LQRKAELSGGRTQLTHATPAAQKWQSVKTNVSEKTALSDRDGPGEKLISRLYFGPQEYLAVNRKWSKREENTRQRNYVQNKGATIKNMSALKEN